MSVRFVIRCGCCGQAADMSVELIANAFRDSQIKSEPRHDFEVRVVVAGGIDVDSVTYQGQRHSRPIHDGACRSRDVLDLNAGFAGNHISHLTALYGKGISNLESSRPIAKPSEGRAA